jgi:glycine/D-amino acid oxidase-like deaminating enzyme
MCPFGHRQHFVAKTEDEERIEKLKKIISLRERDLRWWQDHWNETERAFGTCPVVDCGWRSQSAIHRRWGQMLRHFYKAHPIIMGDSDLLEATRPLKAVS